MAIHENLAKGYLPESAPHIQERQQGTMMHTRDSRPAEADGVAKIALAPKVMPETEFKYAERRNQDKARSRLDPSSSV